MVCTEYELLQNKMYRDSHKAEILAKDALYRKNNRRRLNAEAKVRYRENKDYYLAYGRKYREDSKVRISIQRRKFYRDKVESEKHETDLKKIVEIQLRKDSVLYQRWIKRNFPVWKK